jgi:hypothetical protein
MTAAYLPYWSPATDTCEIPRLLPAEPPTEVLHVVFDLPPAPPAPVLPPEGPRLPRRLRRRLGSYVAEAWRDALPARALLAVTSAAGFATAIAAGAA